MGKKPQRKGSSKKASKLVKTVLAEAKERDFTLRAPLSSLHDCEPIPSSTREPVVREPTQLPSSSAIYPVPNTQQSTLSGIAAFGNSQVHISHLGQSRRLVASQPALVPASTLALSSPPPLISIQQPNVYLRADERPAVEDPFIVGFVHGNIPRCNGCKGRISRGEDGKPLPAPNDLVLRHREHVIFQNPNTGLFQQSRDKRNVYYHAQRTCVAPHFLNFVSEQHVQVDPAITSQLVMAHKELLLNEFGVIL